MEKIQAGSSGFDLSEAGKAAPEKLKTMIRHPIKAKGNCVYGIHQSHKG